MKMPQDFNLFEDTEINVFICQLITLLLNASYTEKLFVLSMKLSFISGGTGLSE